MSRYGDPRSSSSGLNFAERSGPERWDQERFAREREKVERSRAPAVHERERYEEHDHFEFRRDSGGRRRESSVDIFLGVKGGGRGERHEDKDYFQQEERYGPPARIPRGGAQRYYDDELESVDDSPSRGQLIPFERRSRPSITAGRGPVMQARRPPGMPALIRRQSSLDTFDRKPMRRLRDPPETIVIPTPSRRRRSPPRYVEKLYDEEIRIAEPEYYGDEEFRGYKEREVVRRRKAGSELDYRETEKTYEVEEEVEQPYPRKGKTKMPKRLVNRRAIIELGYAFEEEGDTMIILKALGKEHIDEVIKLSKELNDNVKGGESRTTYVIEAPPVAPSAPAPPEVVERRTTEIIISPPQHDEATRSVRDWDDGHRSERGGGRSEHGHRSERGGGRSEHGHSPKGARSEKGGASEKRSVSPVEIKPSRSGRRRAHSSAAYKEYYEEEIGESNSIHGPLALIAPRERKDERSIKAEIRALEAEKKMLKYEREAEREARKAERYRDGEIIIEREREVIGVQKDRKAPNPKLIKAMLATLT